MIYICFSHTAGGAGTRIFFPGLLAGIFISMSKKTKIDFTIARHGQKIYIRIRSIAVVETEMPATSRS